MKTTWRRLAFVMTAGLLLSAAFSVRAGTLAAQVSVTGTTDATTVATVLHQTPGATLTVASPPVNNFGDLTLLVGGNQLYQANGVIIPVPNQF